MTCIQPSVHYLAFRSMPSPPDEFSKTQPHPSGDGNQVAQRTDMSTPGSSTRSGEQEKASEEHASAPFRMGGAGEGSERVFDLAWVPLFDLGPGGGMYFG